MRTGKQMRRLFVSAGLGLVMAGGACAVAQQTPPRHPAPQAAQVPPAPQVDAQAQESQAAEVQDQLLELLRTSPTLTMVVARDPSLLSDPAYVERNNPELAKFLAAHPDVAKDPSYYLFSHLQGRPGRRAEALEQQVWPDMVGRSGGNQGAAERMFDQNIGPGIMGLSLIAAFLWLIKTLLENRRWSRMLKLQTEVHAKLIDRFASNQELLAYMGTDAGQRFLEAAPIAVDPQKGPQMPSMVARVLTPLQIGLVLTLLGIGLLSIRHYIPNGDVPMLVFGMLALMPGIGLMLAAGASWALAQRLGLMPKVSGVDAEERARAGASL